MTKQKPITTHSVAVRGETYYIRRRGSRYNILGPGGRAFKTFQSAALAGPRWEELTHTLWPHPSSAYAPGTRLRELPLETIPTESNTALRSESRQAPMRQPNVAHPVIPIAQPVSTSLPVAELRLALPAPRIDLAEQSRLIQMLHRHPPMLFDPRVQQALRHEVDYHRPDARWAQHLLKLLARYESHQRRQQRAKMVSPATILARHIAWQEEQLSAAAHSG
jgi:hypothetical protein